LPTGTDSLFPEEGINIVSVSIHTHTNGKNVRLSHLRNGRELDRIVNDNHYNYNYQEVRQLANETKVVRGDFLILECSYNTQNLRKPTLGGYSLHEEMCLSFVTYYPKIDLGNFNFNFLCHYRINFQFKFSRMLLDGACEGIFRSFQCARVPWNIYDRCGKHNSLWPRCCYAQSLTSVLNGFCIDK
jgi:Copper type II ascorbate-dependent monooxygenase, C-terminal domain